MNDPASILSIHITERIDAEIVRPLRNQLAATVAERDEAVVALQAVRIEVSLIDADSDPEEVKRKLMRLL